MKVPETLDILRAAREVERAYLTERGTRQEMVAAKLREFMRELRLRKAELLAATPPAPCPWPYEITVAWFRLMHDARKAAIHEPGLHGPASELEDEVRAVIMDAPRPPQPPNDSQEIREIPGAKVRHDDDGRPIIEIVECGHCGARWNNAAVSSLTPVPSARCPFEYEHVYEGEPNPGGTTPLTPNDSQEN